MKLDKLLNFPDSEEGQVKNMQSIINYYKISKQHDLQDTAINFDFIQTYSCKLSRDQKKFLIDNKVETCAPFIAKLKDWQRTNLQFLHTSTSHSAKTFQYVSRPGGDGNGAGNPRSDPPAGNQSSQGNKNTGSGQLGTFRRGNGTFQGKCALCQEKQFIPMRHTQL